jgi:hypothetical protein
MEMPATKRQAFFIFIAMKNIIVNIILPAVAILMFGFSCTPEKKEAASDNAISFSVTAAYPHDKSAFTQGLVIYEGELYESTGQEGSSWISTVDITTGASEKKINLDARYFGEGITILNNKIYQLTWKNKTGFVYDARNFKQLNTFSYQTEGWGLTHDGTNLIMSDGTSRLYFLDTTTFKIVKSIQVSDNTGPVNYLNELEFANGVVYANIWQTSRIAEIDLKDGQVSGYLDLSILTDQAVSLNSSADVLNGIAWHPETRSLLITGKYWPNLFVLKLSRKTNQ